jgi:hypothetical protein
LRIRSTVNQGDIDAAAVIASRPMMVLEAQAAVGKQDESVDSQ